MRIRRLCALLAVVALCSCAAKPGQPPRMVERPDWGRHFQAAGVSGTMVLLGAAHAMGGAPEAGPPGGGAAGKGSAPETGRMLVYNPQRAATGYLPASTFKILNALVGLETGAVEGPDTLFPWDGVQNDVAAWNRDLTLRQAFEVSAVPVYQEVARRIGPERMAWYVRACGYGNADTSGAPPDMFWLSGNLRISALEQIAFLRKLHAGSLPFAPATLETVKDMMVVERGPGWTLRAKTGWATRVTPGIGWWVGWLEREGEVWFFALNVSIVRPHQAQARQAVVKAVLKDMGLL